MRAGVIWGAGSLSRRMREIGLKFQDSPPVAMADRRRGPYQARTEREGKPAQPHTVTPENRCTAILEGRISRTMGFWLKS